MNKLHSYPINLKDRYSNKFYYFTIKQILNNKTIADTSYKQKLAISDIIRKMSNDKYLDIVIRFLRINKILKFENKIIEELKKISINSNTALYKAQIYGLLLEYETQIYHYHIFIKDRTPILKFVFDESNIYHNMSSIISELIRLHNISLSAYLDKQSPQTQKNTYSQLINIFNDFDYRKEEKHFKEDLEYFKIKKENINFEITPYKNKNPYPLIFIDVDAYLLFKSFAENINIKEKLAEYSFLYWAMINDGFISSMVKNKDFIMWIKDSEFKVTLDRVKKIYDFKASKRGRVYQTLKELYNPKKS